MNPDLHSSAALLVLGLLALASVSGGAWLILRIRSAVLWRRRAFDLLRDAWALLDQVEPNADVTDRVFEFIREGK